MKKVDFNKYKIQSDYDLLYRMIVTHNLKGNKGDEISICVGFFKNMVFLKLY